ncbi:DUF1444 family protein [Yoonia sp. BS5-3]|uniref:DUF1444 family protein n=1 Tax=Yoonia phaeophyticola TaxID=3137369 RepID=A0ABZ2V002_9RHOB
MTMRHFFITVFLIIASPLVGDVPRPDSIGETLVLLRDAIRDAGFPDAAINEKEQSVVSDPVDDDAMIAYPDNLHRSLQNASSDAERQAILDNFIIPFTGDLEEPDAFLPQSVMPVLRHVDYLNGADIDIALQQRPFAGDLFVAYVLDFPTHTAAITAERMVEEGYNADTLHNLALDNLAEKAQALTIEGTESGIYYLALDGYYENAMLLDDALWNSITSQIGPIAVSVPTRDFVMIAPQDNADLVKLMQDIRDDALAEAPYALSSTTFLWTDAGWKVMPE